MISFGVDMKPMKDLFLLPVEGLGYEGYQLLTAYEFGHVSSNQAALHAAHAVNNVDALADSLEALIKAVESGEYVSRAIYPAKAALKAYRGEA